MLKINYSQKKKKKNKKQNSSLQLFYSILLLRTLMVRLDCGGWRGSRVEYSRFSTKLVYF